MIDRPTGPETAPALTPSGARILCRLADVPAEAGPPEPGPAEDGLGIVFRDGDRLQRYFVLRAGGALYAYANECPHKGMPLDWQPNRFLGRDRSHILCTSHGARFRIEDGYCFHGPCIGARLRPIPIAVEDGHVVFVAPSQDGSLTKQPTKTK